MGTMEQLDEVRPDADLGLAGGWRPSSPLRSITAEGPGQGPVLSPANISAILKRATS